MGNLPSLTTTNMIPCPKKRHCSCEECEYTRSSAGRQTISDNAPPYTRRIGVSKNTRESDRLDRAESFEQMLTNPWNFTSSIWDNRGRMRA